MGFSHYCNLCLIPHYATTLEIPYFTVLLNILFLSFCNPKPLLKVLKLPCGWHQVVLFNKSKHLYFVSVFCHVDNCFFGWTQDEDDYPYDDWRFDCDNKDDNKCQDADCQGQDAACFKVRMGEKGGSFTLRDEPCDVRHMAV